jgi:hypothetical protein
MNAARDLYFVYMYQHELKNKGEVVFVTADNILAEIVSRYDLQKVAVFKDNDNLKSSKFVVMKLKSNDKFSSEFTKTYNEIQMLIQKEDYR